MKKILVLGLGKSGLAALELLNGRAELAAWDSKPAGKFDASVLEKLKNNGVSLYLGEEPKAEGWDELILSPGVPLFIDLVKKARENGAVISGELQLAFENCKGSFFGITGTNGKTTTTALLGEMVKAAGRRCCVVGNIGLPVASEAASADEDTVMVTEISSFQLETTSSFRPHVSAILNITPDHLDRHKTVEEYARIKHLVHANQTAGDFYIYNADDEGLLACAASMMDGPEKVPFSRKMSLEELKEKTGCRYAAFVKDGKLCFAKEGAVSALCLCSELKIPGSHNLENALAAAACAICGGIDAAAVSEALRSFAGVEHRIEFVREVGGVRYVNDSKGTNPDASQKAVDATQTPILLIAGGYEKNSDFTDFINGFGGKVKYLLLLGQTAHRFADTAKKCGFAEDRMIFCENMEEVIEKAAALASPGDTVLLSPASASWGMYDNYEQRGRHFKSIVNAL